MHSILKQILLNGTIKTDKEFKIFWLLTDSVEDKSPYDLDYSEDFCPSFTIELKEGIAKLLVKRIPDSELTPDNFCKYIYKQNEPLLFYDYDGVHYSSYKELQIAYVEKQLEYYKTVLPVDCEMTIGELDEMCCNADDWNAGRNYTHFLDEGRCLVEGFPVGEDAYMAIYADFEPLTGYEVVSNEEDFNYFKDFKIRINFVYSEMVW